LHPDYAQHYELDRVILETTYQQTYITEFTVNNQPAILVLSSLTQNNNFVTRFWALSKTSDLAIAVPLFKKFSDFV
jgi:hypothetical protein